MRKGSDEPFDPMDDPMAPPREPCECWCMHCQRNFMSNEMWFQRVIGDKHGFEGFWMCPTPNCDGAGFTFDIFPTDPNHPANDGWGSDDGDFEGGFEEEFEDEEDEADAHWDPAEPKYAELDQLSGDQDDDLEGEEWKFGLKPGERPPAVQAPALARLARRGHRVVHRIERGGIARFASRWCNRR